MTSCAAHIGCERRPREPPSRFRRWEMLLSRIERTNCLNRKLQQQVSVRSHHRTHDGLRLRLPGERCAEKIDVIQRAHAAARRAGHPGRRRRCRRLITFLWRRRPATRRAPDWLTAHTDHSANVAGTSFYLLFWQTCSQVLTVRVQVQVRDSMSQPVFLVISKKFSIVILI